MEARIQRPDDEIRWFRIGGEPTIDGGEVVTLCGVVHDITDQKHREDTLREIHDSIPNRQHSFEDKVQILLELGRRELDIEYGTLPKIRGDKYMFEFVDVDDGRIQPGDVVPLSTTNCEIVARTELTLVLGDNETRRRKRLELASPSGVVRAVSVCRSLLRVTLMRRSVFTRVQ